MRIVLQGGPHHGLVAEPDGRPVQFDVADHPVAPVRNWEGHVLWSVQPQQGATRYRRAALHMSSALQEEVCAALGGWPFVFEGRV